MATSTDPTFGAGFDADTFRKKIRQTMMMGLPEKVEDRPTFIWKIKDQFAVAAPSGNPYNFAATPTVKDTAHPPVQIPIAVEYASTSGRTMGGSPIGEFDNTRVTITVLDEDYELVIGADQVKLGGNTYNIEYWAPPIGLFPVTTYQAFLVAEDES
jgi:hypothetical protein